MLYEYACTECEAHTDAFRSVENRNDAPACEKCGAETRKVLSLAKPIGDLQPYFDENLQIGIKSKQHRAQVMREQGVSEKFGTNWLTAASSKRHR